MSGLTPPRGHWGDPRTRSIWRWQLILAASSVAIIALIPLLAPETFGNARFVLGAIAIAVITAATLLVPWHRFGAAAVALLPMLDIGAIGLLSAGGDTRMLLLWVFPIAWLATYYSLAWLIAALSAMTVLLLIDATLAGLTPTHAQRILVVLLCLAFMGVTIQIGARRNHAFRLLLRRQYDQLDRSRQRAEHHAERIAVLSNTLETAIARIDRDGVLLHANRAFLELYGAQDVTTFTPTGAVEYHSHRGEPVSPDDTLIARARRGERFYDHRVWLFDAEGRWRALDVSSRPVPDEQPSNLLLAQDVTAAVRADEQRRTVSAVVTHELRNPLTAIVGHTELLLERDDLPADVRAQLGVLEHAGRRMERLITSTLDADGQVAPELTLLDLRPLVTASVHAFQPAAETAQVELTVDVDGAVPVIGDAFQLRQAIDNVVGNAVKYTARGGAVEVAARCRDTDGAIVVTDTGIGMAPQDRDKIFEPGWRSTTARSSGIAGNGIGMSVVHGIVERHSGRLEITTELGHGTCVTILLPLGAADTAADGGEVAADTVAIATVASHPASGSTSAAPAAAPSPALALADTEGVTP